jgi:hypothetical protein
MNGIIPRFPFFRNQKPRRSHSTRGGCSPWSLLLSVSGWRRGEKAAKNGLAVLLSQAAEVGSVVGRFAEHVPEQHGREEGSHEGKGVEARIALARLPTRLRSSDHAHDGADHRGDDLVVPDAGEVGEVPRLPDDHARSAKPGPTHFDCGSEQVPRRELGERPVKTFRCASDRLHVGDDGRTHHGAKQFLLVREVEVYRAFNEAGATGDVVAPCRCEAMIGEDFQGRRRNLGRPLLPCACATKAQRTLRQLMTPWSSTRGSVFGSGPPSILPRNL